jgi:TRAP-type mannitol/chloroaromatic compound transport system permease small subunit
MHAFLFLVGAGYTLLHGGHVRVDIFYREAAPRAKAWIDFLGVLLLLLPVCALLWWFSWPYVVKSWQVFEGSKETSGIQAVYLLKSLILVFCFLVSVQGLALALRSLLVLAENDVGPEGERPEP